MSDERKTPRDDDRPQDAEPGRAPGRPREDLPPAGPHDRPDLTNPDATPGTGALPPETGGKRDVDPGSG